MCTKISESIINQFPVSMLFVIFVNFFPSVWQVQTVLLLSLAQANASMCDLNSLSVASNLSDFLAALHTYAGKGEDEEPFLFASFLQGLVTSTDKGLWKE